MLLIDLHVLTFGGPRLSFERVLREHDLIHVDEVVVLPFHTFEVKCPLSSPLLFLRRITWRPLLGEADLLLPD